MKVAADAAQPHVVGMTIALPRLGLEDACDALIRLGFGGVEVYIGQLGPGIVDVPLREAHAHAAGNLLAELRLAPVMLNAIDGRFDPLVDFEGSCGRLVEQLRLADAMGMGRLLIWDGILPSGWEGVATDAPGVLARCISTALRTCRIAQPPLVSVELHPFTFALASGLLEETALALTGVGAGICVDFCHFGVALGPGFADRLNGSVLEAVNHVHWCDSDCVTSELHFPPGEGILDLENLEAVFVGRSIELSWDLFAWPTPRAAIAEHMSSYQAAVARHRADGNLDAA